MTTETAAAKDLAAWRAEIRQWLSANVPRDLVGARPLTSPEVLERRRAWERVLYDNGYAAIHWPVEYGGKGMGAAHRMIFQEEYERASAPPRLNIQGLMLVGPTLMQHGTPEQRSRWLQPILRCEEVWCQGFSEPEAGSDLAALRTSARVVGDRYVINGQKIWTSGATYADWMFALVRTDPDAPKHRGITAVLIDMRSPGIEVRPIRQINGRRTFAEVFLDDVEVPVANTVGEMGDGWNVAMSALVLERGIGRRSYVKYLPLLQELRHLAIASGGADDSATLEELGWHVMQVCRYRHHVGRTIAESSDGRFGPEASLNKLFWSEMEAAIYETGMRLHALATATGTEPALSERYPLWEADYWHARATRIFAGSNQIQRNIIAERVLGMPKEKR
ncbi:MULTISPECIES: acyl-CoA dehydrogenase family protein [Thermocrispum]|uniref:Acyl-CoA dehydrogenase n=1 Tax=Thermocrispum agreste TaxID=37925 RepID=A0A2W4LH98_9PSEU|nr:MULTISPECIES: acyl-CoA dehydrogenase family protein [Thermocrispum]PZN00500.1 MAG: acyl-CoA dehydrogenase [Thermocrispum agreste]